MTQEPILVATQGESFEAICEECVHEKNSPFHPDRGWARGENLDDVMVRGSLALEESEAWVTCPYGHWHFVVRQGSERARNFGFA